MPIADGHHCLRERFSPQEWDSLTTDRTSVGALDLALVINIMLSSLEGISDIITWLTMVWDANKARAFMIGRRL